MESRRTSNQADQAIRRAAFCPEHGFIADPGAEVCPRCGLKSQRQFPPIAAEEWPRLAAELPPAEKAKPFQFGLKALLIGVTLIGAWLGMLRVSPGVAMLLLVGLAPPLLTWKYQWGYDGMLDLSRVGRAVLCLTAIMTIGPSLALFGAMIGLFVTLPFAGGYDGATVLLTAIGFFCGGCGSIAVAMIFAPRDV